MEMLTGCNLSLLVNNAFVWLFFVFIILLRQFMLGIYDKKHTIINILFVTIAYIVALLYLW